MFAISSVQTASMGVLSSHSVIHSNCLSPELVISRTILFNMSYRGESL